MQTTEINVTHYCPVIFSSSMSERPPSSGTGEALLRGVEGSEPAKFISIQSRGL
jgi:hypothetical protein